MKILMLGWELPPHNSGGLGVACYQLCKSLAENGADIDFILPYRSDDSIGFMKIISATQMPGKDFDLKLNPYDGFGVTASQNREVAGHQSVYETFVEEFADSKQFDVIHAHDWMTFRAALRVKHRQNMPLILHVHSIERDRAGGSYGNPLVREIEYTSMMLADRVIAVSEHTKKMIVEDYGLPPDKIDVIHNSVDFDLFSPAESENSYRYLNEMKKNGWRVVANVGRLTIQKGLPNLIRAAALVVREHPKTFFLFVGSGEQRDELIDLAAELNIADRVIFTGFLRGNEWSDAYRIADLFVMPSVSEPFGLTPLEAIGYGTPALVSKQSGVSEILKNCLKVDYWDVDEMANQIASVVSNDSLRDSLHASAYQEFLKLSWQSSTERILDMYRHEKAWANA